MPSKANLSIYQGDDYAGVVTVSGDLTGHTAQAQIRAGYADANPEIVVEIDCEIDGQLIALSIPGSKTVTLTGSGYQWDLQLVSPTGGVSTILYGAVPVTLEVTRPVAVAEAA